MQELVKDFVAKYNLETSPEIRFIDLMSETGELGKEILKGNSYGKETCEKTSDLESEMGDVLFSLMCIANTMDVNLEEALKGVLAKYEKRFKKKGEIGSGE